MGGKDGSRRGYHSPMKFAPLFFVVFGSLFVTPVAAPDDFETSLIGSESPAASWKVIETEHLRFYFPAPLESWTSHVASRAEAIHEAVAAAVGFDRKKGDEKIVVLVVDPVAEPNGSALSLLASPQVVLWASPPGSDSAIGTSRDWGEMVFTHELAHILHLGRPRNHPSWWARIFFPAGPVAIGSPRWVAEGYATLIEGKLTGSGRPNAAFRAAVLRQWAVRGRLPGYGELDAGEDWLSGSYAYLVGSAFLEWLEKREGEGSLARLWKQMAGERALDFSEAFLKTFGQRPRELYGLFVADMTARAIEDERVFRNKSPREGVLWQRFEGSTGSPAVSPDGKRIVFSRRPPKSAQELAVFTIEPDEEERKSGKKREEKEAKRLLDPNEAPDRPEEAPLREPEARLAEVDGHPPMSPRWLPDSRRVSYLRKSVDPYGVLHGDLWIWEPASGSVRQITHFAGLRSADPLPDGQRALGLQIRSGRCRLVFIDLEGGAMLPVEMKIPGSDDDAFDVLSDPRVSADGRTAAVCRQHGGRWELWIVSLSGESPPRRVDLEDAEPAGPPAFWGDGSAILAGVVRNGVENIEDIDLTSPGVKRLVTNGFGASLAPAPTPGGESVFFLSPGPGGVDLRRIELARGDGAPRAGGFPEGGAFPLYPPSPRPELPPFGLSPARITPRDYRFLDGLSWRFGTGFRASASGRSYEPMIGGGDVVGRFDWSLAGSIADRGEIAGGAGALRWRGFDAAEIGFRVFDLIERPGKMQRVSRVALDRDRIGIEIQAGKERNWSHGFWRFGLAALSEKIDPQSGDAFDRRLALGELAGSFERRWRDWGGALYAVIRGGGGRSGGRSWRVGRAELSARVETPAGTFSYSADEGATRGEPGPWDRFNVGGGLGSLAPESDELVRAGALALPAAVLSGERVDHRRAELRCLELLRFYAESFRTAKRDSSEPGERIRIAGVELELDVAEFPVKLGGKLQIALGAAHIYDEPLKGRNAGYLTLRIRP